jgi:Exopolysaccharide biosynthesis protein related to N-acetylglucosamine-1-phosphodiester alpha-N-acetylglucosaminidase
MKKLALLVLVLAILLPCTAFAELPVDDTPGFVPDAAKFTETGYEDESITVVMEKYHEHDTDINVARVTIKSPTQLRTALAGKFGTTRTNRVTSLAEQNNAVVAMSGDYYANRDRGYIVRQGVTYRKTPFKTLDMLIIDDLGDFHILVKSNAAELKAFLESDRTIVNALNFGPALVIDGVAQEIPSNYEFNPRGTEPRAAIGQLDTLTYMMVVVDGRTDDNKGLRMSELADFMARMGCTQAFNLDGGNTATLVFNNQLYCDKSNSGERSVSDIIYFASAVPGVVVAE